MEHDLQQLSKSNRLQHIFDDSIRSKGMMFSTCKSNHERQRGRRVFSPGGSSGEGGYSGISGGYLRISEYFIK